MKLKYFILIACCLGGWQQCTAQYKYIITTVAGNGIADYTGDGGLATNAACIPNSVALDGANNMYLGDQSNVVREVDAKTGIISTIAGTGLNMFSGDGGAAIMAGMSDPKILYADTRGVLYIADNGRIRKIDDTRKIYTIAGNGHGGFSSDGGLADTTMIGGGGTGLWVDSMGNIIFSDGNNCRLRKVNMGSGIITTIAGTGSSVISGDGGLAIAAGLGLVCGFTYNIKTNAIDISDLGYATIRKIDMHTGIINTIAGNGSPYAYSGDGGPALDAGFYQPYYIFCDKNGNLIIADMADNVIRRIDATTGIINTIAGAKYGSTTGVGGYSGDGADANNAKLNAPGDIAIDSSGDIYFVDAKNFRIRKLAIATDVSNIFLENILNIYPDPANDFIKLDIEHAQSAYIYNAVGMQVSIVENISATANSLDVSTLPTGVYIVAIVYKDGSKKTGRFIKR